MISLKINNLRSLIDIPEIQIKPITLLIGANGSGKSTFLRTFPLLKQTLLNRTRGAILWAGDENSYVDFGDFSTSLSTSATNKEITFEINIPVSLIIVDQVESLFNPFGPPNHKSVEDLVHLAVSIKHQAKAKLDYVYKVVLKYKDETIELKIKPDGEIASVSSNGRVIRLKKDNLLYHRLDYEYSFLGMNYSPLMRYFEQVLIPKLLVGPGDKRLSSAFPSFIPRILYLKFVKCLTYGELNEEVTPEELLKIFIPKEDTFNSLKINETEYAKHTLIAYNSLQMLNVIFGTVRNLLIYSSYFEPIRAYAQRYYPLRNVSIDEIDSTGKNLAMYINSLSDNQVEKLNEFTTKHLSFTISKKASEGHVSLSINDDSKTGSYNIADTGFGYSQLIPMIIQIWKLVTSKERRSKSRIVCIEQPELHLHPRLQSLFIKLLASVVNEEDNNLSFILETHSETFVNEIGNLIRKKTLNQDDVNIVIFEKEAEKTNVRMSGYDADGFLLDSWPFGFFDPIA